MFDKDGSAGTRFTMRSSIRRAWRVGAAVAALIAAGGLSAAQAAAKVIVRLLEFDGGKPLRSGSEVDIRLLLGNGNGYCERTFSATVAETEAPKDELTSPGDVTEETCPEGMSISGFVSKLQLTAQGKLTTKASKLVLSRSHCADLECKFMYNCVYEVSKLPPATISIPGGVEAEFIGTVKGKLDKKESGAQCATEEAFAAELNVYFKDRGMGAVWAEDTT